MFVEASHVSYWILIPIVCSGPGRDLQHDCMHWVQSEGIFSWLMFYLRVVYVFMTVPVTKLLSNLYYGSGWSSGLGIEDTAAHSAAHHCQYCSGNGMQSAGSRRGQSPLHLVPPFPVWFHHPWNKWYLEPLTHPRRYRDIEGKERTPLYPIYDVQMQQLFTLSQSHPPPLIVNNHGSCEQSD